MLAYTQLSIFDPECHSCGKKISGSPPFLGGPGNEANSLSYYLWGFPSLEHMPFIFSGYFPPEHQHQFREWRKKHYNEFYAVQRARELLKQVQ